jgi:hypothetical protein
MLHISCLCGAPQYGLILHALVPASPIVPAILWADPIVPAILWADPIVPAILWANSSALPPPRFCHTLCCAIAPQHIFVADLFVGCCPLCAPSRRLSLILLAAPSRAPCRFFWLRHRAPLATICHHSFGCAIARPLRRYAADSFSCAIKRPSRQFVVYFISCAIKRAPSNDLHRILL